MAAWEVGIYPLRGAKRKGERRRVGGEKTAARALTRAPAPAGGGRGADAMAAAVDPTMGDPA